jgi:mediator of RNA polymerase II transcription subunit 24
MIEPQSRILAKLCVYCVIAAIEAPAPHASSKKRATDAEDPPAKVRKTNNPDISSDSCSNDFPEPISSGNEPPNSVREPLQSALQQLLKIFSQYVVTDELTPKIYFIFQFLSLLVQFGGDRIKSVLRLPSGLIQNVLKIIPIEDLTMGFVVRSHDLTMVTGRQNAITDLCLLRNIQIRRDSIKL